MTVNRPTTRDLADFLARICSESDREIREAHTYIEQLRCPNATPAQQTRVRRLARECIYLAVHGRASEAQAAWARLDNALTYATDDTGQHREYLRVRYIALVERGEAHRAEYRREKAAASGDLPPEFRAYQREVDNMYAQWRTRRRPPLRAGRPLRPRRRGVSTTRARCCHRARRIDRK